MSSLHPQTCVGVSSGNQTLSSPRCHCWGDVLDAGEAESTSLSTSSLANTKQITTLIALLDLAQ